MRSYFLRLLARLLARRFRPDPAAVQHHGQVLYGFLWTPDERWEACPSTAEQWLRRGYEMYDLHLSSYGDLGPRGSCTIVLKYTYRVRPVGIAPAPAVNNHDRVLGCRGDTWGCDFTADHWRAYDRKGGGQ